VLHLSVDDSIYMELAATVEPKKQVKLNSPRTS